MMISRALFMAVLLAAPITAQTQSQVERRYSRDYNQCMDASGGVTVEMMNCSGAEIDRQDARLNQAYVMVMRRLPAPKKVVLRNSERLWIQQRDARCSRAAKSEGGGSLANIIYSNCILDETIKRTIWLENYKG